MTAASPRPHAPLPYPQGWFAVATSAELPADTVLTRRLAGEDRVLFRDTSGKVTALDPYCPHLGAHMGQGGTVKDGKLVCPFHGFQFDRDGQCVATSYGSRPPKALGVPCFSVVESGGWIFVWFHPEGAAPSWTPPEVSLAGFTDLRATTLELRTHPQETTENSVDLGHFPKVHGFEDVRLHGFSTEGPHLQTQYGFRRPAGFPGLGRNLQIEIEVHVWGLGFSYVDVKMPALGLLTRQYVMPTAVAPGLTELRLGMALQRGADADWRLRMLPNWLFNGMVADLAQRSYVEEVLADRHVWENKVHVARPALADGDGPIGRYRVWCRQFYAASSGGQDLRAAGVGDVGDGEGAGLLPDGADIGQ